VMLKQRRQKTQFQCCDNVSMKKRNTPDMMIHKSNVFQMLNQFKCNFDKVQLKSEVTPDHHFAMLKVDLPHSDSVTSEGEFFGILWRANQSMWLC